MVAKRRLIIAGSRNAHITNDRIYTWVDWAMRSFWDNYDWEIDDIEIVSGGATGIDSCGERWSREYLKVEPVVFKAEWNRFGKAAGNIRNKTMAAYGDAALIWMRNEPSPGSSNMAAWMALFEKPFKVLFA